MSGLYRMLTILGLRALSAGGTPQTLQGPDKPLTFPEAPSGEPLLDQCLSDLRVDLQACLPHRVGRGTGTKCFVLHAQQGGAGKEENSVRRRCYLGSNCYCVSGTALLGRDRVTPWPPARFPPQPGQSLRFVWRLGSWKSMRVSIRHGRQSSRAPGAGLCPSAWGVVFLASRKCSSN